MELADKIEVLISNFTQKYGYKPTCVLLPEVKQDKFLGLLVKQGNKLAVGLGTKLVFWSDNQELKLAEKPTIKPKQSFAELLQAYKQRKVGLQTVLNAIIDYEHEQRT